MLSPLPIIDDLEELDGKSIVRTQNIEDKLYMILKEGEDQYLAVFHQTYDENVDDVIDVCCDRAFDAGVLHKLGLIDDLAYVSQRESEKQQQKAKNRADALASIKGHMCMYGISISELEK